MSQEPTAFLRITSPIASAALQFSEIAEQKCCCPLVWHKRNTFRILSPQTSCSLDFRGRNGEVPRDRSQTVNARWAMSGVGCMRTGSSGWLIAVSMALTMGTAAPSFAQQNTSSGGQGQTTSPGSQGNAPSGGPEISPTGEYQAGLSIGAWMLYPELFVGAVWDSNSNQASSNQAAQTATGSSPDSGTSLAVSPRLVATTSDGGSGGGGLHSSTLFGVGHFQFFSANTVTADAGFLHTYKPTEDLSLNLNLLYARQTDLFTSALNFNNNAIALHGGPAIPSPTIINPFGTTPSINPVAYNQYTAGGSVSKTWDTWFTTLSGTAFRIQYDHANNIPAPFNTSQDATAFWLDGRVGWHFVPSLYVFGDVAGIWQRYTNSIFNTNGYRVTGGLGTDDPGSLIRGEVYGG